MGLELVKPSLRWKEEHLAFLNEWEKTCEEITPYAIKLLDMTYNEWLKNVYNIEKRETCPDELVMASTYFLVNNNRILGAVNIRHELNDYLFKYGGHIGYGVRPSERKKGYATKMLQYSLQEAKKLGLSRVLVICDKDNIASAKTIQKNGGILENEVIEENGNIVQRYWVELN